MHDSFRVVFDKLKHFFVSLIGLNVHLLINLCREARDEGLKEFAKEEESIQSCIHHLGAPLFVNLIKLPGLGTLEVLVANVRVGHGYLKTLFDLHLLH